MTGDSAPAPDALLATVMWRASRLAPVARQTAFLVAVEGISNVLDYGFHIALGRSLPASGFAVVQTVNAALLIVLTAAGVWQPVTARFVAESERQKAPSAASIFQHYFWLSLAVGGALALVVWLARDLLASWLNVPAPAITFSAAVLAIAFSRPVVAGVLQGQRRFVAFGLSRSAYAGGRLLLALVLVTAMGGGALVGVATIPLAATLSLAVGITFLGREVWRRAPALPRDMRHVGWRLSGGALLAYGAYMALLNLDLVWVNRLFDPQVAGSYASTVLLRRVLSLLPGAVIVVVYPRVVALHARKRVPDRLLVQAVLAIVVPSLALSTLYFALPELLIRLSFGAKYVTAAPYLGWLALAVTGYALAALWMNVFLATRPAPYIGLLLITALAQAALYSWRARTVAEIVGVFGAAGWLLALAGALLYVAWLRPATRGMNEHE